MIIIGRVGSKGELFPPKRVREALGLKPHMKVIYRVERGRLVVEPIPSLEDVLKEQPAVEITPEEFYEFRKKLSREAEL
ncbi:AbrB/MazE/SpoVT family DNA-binding domain-containing protein [Candidatus Bathyarchaeota archaeon]|nr:MAG: AbrB/MazE/SpoVT family DNA-binding domain-containing protein [Candidatus Bathyarchaeota archaeon]